MRDLGGAPAWEGECVPMMHAQPCTSLLAPTVLQTPLRAVCGSVWSGLNPSPSVHVTQTGTPLALTPVCTGSLHQLEEELKFKTLEGRETLLQTRHFPCLFPALQAPTGSAGAQRVMATLWQPW